MFDFGRLEMHGTGVGDIQLPVLSDPVALRKAVQDGMTAAAQQATPAAIVPMTAAPAETSRPAA